VAIDIEYTDEFGSWWADLGEDEQSKVTASIDLLALEGTALGFPHTSKVATSRHEHMRELRIQVGGNPYRVLYAFNPLRTGILLLGGDKTGSDRWYKTNVPIADRLYDEHLADLKREGLI
jgi:hypothetical protein